MCLQRSRDSVSSVQGPGYEREPDQWEESIKSIDQSEQVLEVGLLTITCTGTIIIKAIFHNNNNILGLDILWGQIYNKLSLISVENFC